MTDLTPGRIISALARTENLEEQLFRWTDEKVSISKERRRRNRVLSWSYLLELCQMPHFFLATDICISTACFV